MSRLTIDVSDEQHKTLKAAAALEGKSIKAYALERLLPTACDVDQEEAWEDFRVFIGKRVNEAMAGDFSEMTAEEIFDDELLRDEAA